VAVVPVVAAAPFTHFFELASPLLSLPAVFAVAAFGLVQLSFSFFDTMSAIIERQCRRRLAHQQEQREYQCENTSLAKSTAQHKASV
jgi:hypothetical protein